MLIKSRAFLKLSRSLRKFRVLAEDKHLPIFCVCHSCRFTAVMSTNSDIKHDQIASPSINLLSEETAHRRKRTFSKESTESVELQQSCPEKSEALNDTLLSVLPFIDVDEDDKIKSKTGRRARKPKKKSKGQKKCTSENGPNVAERPKRPNYFVALQITSPQIHENVDNVQKHVTSQNSLFSHALIRTQTLHLTLAVLHMDDKDNTILKKSFDAMEKVKENLTTKMQSSPLELEFEGLGNFENEVLFVTIKGKEALTTLTSIAVTVQEIFEAEGLHLTDKRFAAHLTVMKLSKMPFKVKKEVKKIPPQLYQVYKEFNFGKDIVSCVQLLSMSDKKDPETGYYKCLKQVYFTEK